MLAPTTTTPAPNTNTAALSVPPATPGQSDNLQRRQALADDTGTVVSGPEICQMLVIAIPVYRSWRCSGVSFLQHLDNEKAMQ